MQTENGTLGVPCGLELVSEWLDSAETSQAKYDVIGRLLVASLSSTLSYELCTSNNGEEDFEIWYWASMEVLRSHVSGGGYEMLTVDDRELAGRTL